MRFVFYSLSLDVDAQKHEGKSVRVKGTESDIE